MKVTRATTFLLLVIAAHQSNALDVINPSGKRRMRTNAPDVFPDSGTHTAASPERQHAATPKRALKGYPLQADLQPTPFV